MASVVLGRNSCSRAWVRVWRAALALRLVLDRRAARARLRERLDAECFREELGWWVLCSICMECELRRRARLGAGLGRLGLGAGLGRLSGVFGRVGLAILHRIIAIL